MRTLYESLLDDYEVLSKRADTIVDIFESTKNIFKRLKSMDPMDFYMIRNSILDGHPFPNNYNLSEDEIVAFSNFIKHMHKKYGQQDIYSSAWCLSEPIWKVYEINSGMSAYDKKYLADELNLYITTIPSKFDQWICGLDNDSETAWMMATLKKMKKGEKEAWLEIMKAIERYFN